MCFLTRKERGILETKRTSFEQLLKKSFFSLSVGKYNKNELCEILVGPVESHGTALRSRKTALSSCKEL